MSNKLWISFSGLKGRRRAARLTEEMPYREGPLPRSGSAAGRPWRHAAAATCLLLGLGAACGGSSGAASHPTPPAAAAATPAPGHQLRAALVATQLAVGTDRFPIGVSDHNTPITDAAVHVRVFANTGNVVALKGEADAPYSGDGLEGHGLYVAHFHFDVPGLWQAEIAMKLPDGYQATVDQQFGVRLATEVPMVGQPAPRSHNPTAADVPDVSYIDSGQPPDDMHSISIADAVAQHQPTLVVFATPAFCTSATCGPQVNAVQALEPGYRGKLTFIHVEVYTNFKPNPAARTLAPTMTEWHLSTEPWIFLVNRSGNVAAVFEGPTGTDELKQAVDQLLAAG